MLYRVIIKRETSKYFIGKSYNNKRYKIEKNQYSNLELVMIYIFAERKKF